MKPPLRGLYLLVDESVLAHARWPQLLPACLRAGPALVQYRAKLLSAEQRAAHAAELLALCRAEQIPLLINDDLALCQALDADGVHLGQDDGQLSLARQQLGPDKLIGASCYADLLRARQAEQAGVDYVSFGRLFDSRTKPQASPAPLQILGQARSRLSPAICAIGGIDTSNAAQVKAAGADLLCVAGGIWRQPDPLASCEKLATICRSP